MADQRSLTSAGTVVRCSFRNSFVWSLVSFGLASRFRGESVVVQREYSDVPSPARREKRALTSSHCTKCSRLVVGAWAASSPTFCDSKFFPLFAYLPLSTFFFFFFFFSPYTENYGGETGELTPFLVPACCQRHLFRSFFLIIVGSVRREVLSHSL